VKSVTQNLRGLIFLGTPFQGSATATLGENVRKILKLFSVSTQQHTLELLATDSQRLRQLVRSFAEILNKRRISQEEEDRIEAFFCYETLKTSALGIPLMQVRFCTPL
jgi:protein SERAC1